MRLGTHVAVEAVVGIAVLGGVVAGTWYGVGLAQDYVGSLGVPHAHAATLHEPLITPFEARLGSPALRPVEPAPSPAAPTSTPTWTVFPADDETLLAPLRDAPVVGTRLNKGGSSLSIRLDFASGGRAAFKPVQIWPQSKPRREIAAYRIDRYLHIGRVPPAIARVFPVADLVAGFEEEKRRYGTRIIGEEALPENGELAGSVSWWIPEIAIARINGFDIDETDGVVSWKRLVRAGAHIPDEHRWLAEQLSTLTLFDFIIDNIDRWTGGNVRIAPGGKQLFFMDNTFSFTNDPYGHRKGQNYLKRVEVFSRDLVGRLRAMTEDDLRRIMEPGPGPFDYLLTDREIAATLGRRDWALAYIDRLVERYGEDAVLAFP